MKKVIDEQGRLLGKVNVIDFLVIMVVLILIPLFYIGQKVMRKSYKEIAEYVPKEEHFPPRESYEIERVCPNCGKPISIEVKTGTPAKGIFPYKTMHNYCKVEVVLEK